MKTIKDLSNFCNAALFHEYKNVGITCELNQVRKCIINSFYRTIPYSRILVRLSIVDDINLKFDCNDFENFIENVHDLKENILYMLSFGKLIKDDQQTIRPILRDDDDQE